MSEPTKAAPAAPATSSPSSTSQSTIPKPRKRSETCIIGYDTCSRHNGSAWETGIYAFLCDSKGAYKEDLAFIDHIDVYPSDNSDEEHPLAAVLSHEPRFSRRPCLQNSEPLMAGFLDSVRIS
jgi:hypothetical protein